MITLEQAERIIDAILTRARELRCRPMSAVVVEPGGPVEPGTGWPDDLATSRTPVARSVLLTASADRRSCVPGWRS